MVIRCILHAWACPSKQGEMHMAKISLAGFKDPVRRPRYIIWTVLPSW